MQNNYNRYMRNLGLGYENKQRSILALCKTRMQFLYQNYLMHTERQKTDSDVNLQYTIIYKKIDIA